MSIIRNDDVDVGWEVARGEDEEYRVRPREPKMGSYVNSEERDAFAYCGSCRTVRA